MNNVQKARLLHALFLLEIPSLLTYTKEQSLYLANHADEVRAGWGNQLFSFDWWLELSRDIHLKIEKYGRSLEKSSVTFSEQLFDGYGAIYMTHCLLRYVEEGKAADPKFGMAAALFFNP